VLEGERAPLRREASIWAGERGRGAVACMAAILLLAGLPRI
jgi:hypothetical protein